MKPDPSEELKQYGLSRVDISDLLCLNADFSPLPGCDGPSFADPDDNPKRQVDRRFKHVIGACYRQQRHHHHMLLNNAKRYLDKNFAHGWPLLMSMVPRTKRDAPLWRCCTALKAPDRSPDAGMIGVVTHTSDDQAAFAPGMRGHSLITGESEDSDYRTLQTPFQDGIADRPECNKPTLISSSEFFPNSVQSCGRSKHNSGRIEKQQFNRCKTLRSAKRNQLQSLSQEDLEQIIQASSQQTRRRNLPILAQTIEEQIDRCFEYDKSYAQAVKGELQRVGSLSSMGRDRVAPQWAAAGHLMPYFIPADDCRSNWPDRCRLIDNLYFSGTGNHGVYTRGQPTKPIDQPLSSVVKQLWLPDTKKTYYATNIRTTNAEVYIPDCIESALDIFSDDKDVTMVNITPRGALIDIHWDRGNVLTAIDDGCVKLWGFYPLSDENCKELRKVDKTKSLLLQLSGRLEGGEWALQTSKEAVFAAAGTLHVVVTLEGGCVPGRVFHAAQDLETAKMVWQLEQCEILPHTKADKPEMVCDFLKKIHVGLRELRKAEEGPIRKDQALELLCSLHEYLPRVKRLQVWVNVRRMVGKNCEKCGNKW